MPSTTHPHEPATQRGRTREPAPHGRAREGMPRARTQTPGLTRKVHEIRSVGMGAETRLRNGHLTVDPAGAARLLQDPALAEVRVSWVSPGEAARIVRVLDAVEPRTKGPGGAGVFPGFVSPPRPQGRGETHVLQNCAVVAAGFLPRAQEAVIEMAGDARALSPLGCTHNLVVEFEPAQGASFEHVEAALRRGLLALAAALAETALAARPDRIDELPGPAAAPSSRPRVAAVTNLQTQGAFKDVFVYGRTLAGGLPTLIDANELEDGVVVSGQYGHPALKNPTYLHQNHPVVAALRARADVELAAVVLCPEPVEQEQKELIAEHAARLCVACGFDGAIVTKEGGGNADADVALKLDALEAAGIPAVGIFAEMAGPDGSAPPLVVAPTRGNATVSAGNYDERLRLPAVERAVGGDRVEVAGAGACDAMELPCAAIYGALNPLGWGRLTCAEAS